MALHLVIEHQDGGKLEKDDPKVVYMGPEKGPFKCQRCEYFKTPHACAKVDGEIDAHGCCNLFDPIKKR